MLRNLTEEEIKLLSNVIGPCLDRKTIARSFYGEFDQLKEREIKLHIMWCQNCQETFIAYLSELDQKSAACLDEKYFQELFAEQKKEKIISIIHTLQCENCLKAYIKARGHNSELDRLEERLGESSDPISRLIYLRSRVIKRFRAEVM